MTSHNKAELDGIGWQLLQALQDDARLTFRELAEKVKLSPTAVAHRVRRMEKQKIITGYHATVNTKKVGLPITAFIRVTAQGAKTWRLEEFTRKSPDVLECHKVTGDLSFILKVAFSSTEHLDQLIDALREYSDPVTSIVLSSPVERRVIDRYDQEEQQFR